MSDTESKDPFTEAGDCTDEVEFVFDDGQKLYVSQNFLGYVSPVFKAMFQHDFLEKETRSVTLKGKVYGDFKEFLLCLHPDVQKTIDRDNVFTVVNLAHEYQAKLIIRKCKDAMLKLLQSELESARKSSAIYGRVERALTCLRVLTKGEELQYKYIVDEACKVIGNFGHTIFNGTVTFGRSYKAPPVFQFGVQTVTPKQKPYVNIECKRLFDNLPVELKYRLLSERLRLCDNVEMHTP